MTCWPFCCGYSDDPAYRALGINTRRERDCKRRLEEAGRRLVAVDELYVDFAVTPDPARPGARLLTVVRRGAQQQLTLGDSLAA